MKLVGSQTKKKKNLVQFLKGWDGPSPTTLRVEGECAFMLKIKILYIYFILYVCLFLKKQRFENVYS